MKKIICKKEYDTETSTLVKKSVNSYFCDPAGYGLYFVYACGGEASPYPNEEISRLAKTKVNDWLETH